MIQIFAKPKTLSKEERELQDMYINMLIDIEAESDLAVQHQLADTLLTNLLTQLGYTQLIERYETLERHYNI